MNIETTIYIDASGWKYQVMLGIGEDTYKARYQKPGSRRWACYPRLPWQSTLEEAKEADLLIQVVDYSDEHYKEQIAVTNQTLKKLQADGIPMLFVYNKSDLVSADALPGLSGVEGEEVAAHLPVVAKTHGESVGDGIYLSAKKRIGMEELVCLIEEKLSGGYRECTLLIPYTDGRAVSYLNENAVVFETAYEEKGVRMRVNCKKEDYGYYRKYAEG